MSKQKRKIIAPPPNQSRSAKNKLSEYEKFFPLIAVAVSCIVFLPALQNGFVNLDDTQYIIENPVIKNISTENLRIIFSQQFLGNYQPLTMLSYMLDYNFFVLNPFGYHLVNLILHLLSTWLVFLIIKKLSGNGVAAFIASLLFGIHPLHAESVAWIAERKDVLYGFYFLWSLYAYILHTKQEKWFSRHLLLSLLLFVCSLLSKAQAVVLPVIFFLLDFLTGRRLVKKTIFEKIPFFLLAIAFGVIAIKVQGKAGAVQSFQYFPFHERILFSCYALMTYLHKLILPINLSCFYPYPETNNKINSIWVYLSPVVLVALAILIWTYLRKSKVILFGIFFFLFTIALVLNFFPIGDALYADRYTYISSIGLFFIAAHFIALYIKNKMIIIISTIYILLLCFTTFQRTRVWHDSITLYTDALNKGFRAPIIYNNRGAAFAEQGKNEAALKDFTSLVEIKPRYPNGWRNKALVHERLGQTDEAIKSYSEEMNYFPVDIKNYMGRGLLLVGKNDFETAIKDFSKVIMLEPGNGEAYNLRAEVYAKSGKIENALLDFNKAIELSPGNGEIYNNRGIVYGSTGRFKEALNDFNKSLDLKPENYGVYMNRALAYKGMGMYSEALQDILTAKEKGSIIDDRTVAELNKLNEGNK